MIFFISLLLALGSCNSQQQIQILSDGEIAAVTVAVILIGTTLLLLLILFAVSYDIKFR